MMSSQSFVLDRTNPGASWPKSEIANTFQYLTYLEWGGFGVSAEMWSAIMMAVATGLAAFMVRARGNWLFPLVFGWAFIEIHKDLWRRLGYGGGLCGFSYLEIMFQLIEAATLIGGQGIVRLQHFDQ